MKNLTPENAFIFRIVHIENLPWILQNGLHCRSSNCFDPNYINIGNVELIDRRSTRLVAVAPGGTLSDYVPFYFTPCTPMLLNIKTGRNGVTRRSMEEIVIFAGRLRTIAEQRLPFLFTDRHAYLVAAHYSNNLDDLARINWDLLQTRNFRRDTAYPEHFEQYQAEALIHRHVPLSALVGIACHSASAKARVETMINGLGLGLQIVVKPEWYP